MRNLLGILTTVFLCTSSPAVAQHEYDPNAGLTWFEQALAAAEELLPQKWAVSALDEPSFTPSSKQVEAPSSGPVSTSLIDRASTTELWSVALDNAMSNSPADKAFTLNLNLFSVLAARDPTILDSNDEYAKYRTIRRLSGILSFSESLPDSATADSLGSPRFGDVINLRARIRLIGSRDRRDHWDQYKTRLAPLQTALHEALKQVGQDDVDFVDAKTDAERFDAAFAYLMAHPETTVAVLREQRRLVSELTKINREIDHSFLMTLDVGGEFRDDQVGKDRFTAAVIAEGGGVGVDFTGVVRYLFEEGESGSDSRELFVGGSISSKLLRGSAISADGVDLSLGVAGQFRNNDRDDSFLFNAKIEFPLSNGLRIPLSFTWDNQRDATALDELVVSMGLGFDFAGSRQ